MEEQDLQRIRNDFLTNCADSGVPAKTAQTVFDDVCVAFTRYHAKQQPKPLRKRFFGMLKRWAIGHEGRKQYRRGMAECRVIVDEYRNSQSRYLNNKTLTMALQARKEELWNDWNLQMYRINIRTGFDRQWAKDQPEIDKIMNRDRDE